MKSRDQLSVKKDRDIPGTRKARARNGRVTKSGILTMFATHPYPMWVYDRRTLRFLDVNDAAVSKYGYSRDEFLQLRVAALRPRDVASLERPEAKFSGQQKHRLKDGRLIDAQVTSHQIKLGGRNAVMVTAEDITGRKKVGETLWELNLFTKSIISSAQEGIVVYDRNLRYSVWNRYMEQLTGIPGEVVLGKDPRHLFPFIEEQGIFKYIERALAGETVSSPDIHYRIPQSGKEGWVSALYCPHRNLRGEIVGVIGLIRDITRRKQAEDALAHEQQLLRALVDTIPDQIYFKDTHGKFLLVNQAFLTDRGLSTPQEAIGKSDSDLLAKGTAEEISTEDQALLRDGRPLINREKSYSDRRGIRRWMLMTKIPLRDSQGLTTGLVGVHRDITDFKMTTARLRESEVRMRLLVEQLPAVLWTTDADMRFTLSLGAGLKSLGLKPNELVGVCLQEFPNGPGKGDLVVVAAHQHALEGESLAFEQMIHGHVYQSYVEPLRDDHGTICGTIGIALDITERRRVEEELAQRAADLSRSNAELEQFAYIASHDLQENLRMVASYCQLLERRYKGKLDTDADEFIGYAVKGAMRMRDLLRSLLEYSRAGASPQAHSTVNMCGVCDNAIANLSESIRHTTASIERTPLPFVHGHAGELTQVLQNLIGNAIKFRGDLPPHIQIGATLEADKWIFHVRDNGIGIDPKHHQRIFVIFNRLHSREKYPGAGTGLAICQKILERHGGRLWVESEKGKGATFYFTLPVREGGHPS